MTTDPSSECTQVPSGEAGHTLSVYMPPCVSLLMVYAIRKWVVATATFFTTGLVSARAVCMPLWQPSRCLICTATLHRVVSSASVCCFDLGLLNVVHSGSDVLLVVDRRKIEAHKAILASRSQTFAELIDQEEANGMIGPGAKLELVLSELSLDTAVSLLEFMYTDNLAQPLTPLSPNLGKLLYAAQKYKLNRLAAMCRYCLCCTC